MGDDEGSTSEQPSSPAASSPTTESPAADVDVTAASSNLEEVKSEETEQFVTNVMLEESTETTTIPPNEEEKMAESNNPNPDETKKSTFPPKPSVSRKQRGVTSSLAMDASYVHDPNTIAIKFIFANRDGLNVFVKSLPTDTIQVLKQSLLSLWPKELGSTAPESGRIRLICMGKGVLTPDTLTLTECDVPIFTTHPTPINVSVKPLDVYDGSKQSKSFNSSDSGVVDNECCCTIS